MKVGATSTARRRHEECPNSRPEPDREDLTAEPMPPNKAMDPTKPAVAPTGAHTIGGEIVARFGI
jgi:hypothetical protein